MKALARVIFFIWLFMIFMIVGTPMLCLRTIQVLSYSVIGSISPDGFFDFMTIDYSVNQTALGLLFVGCIIFNLLISFLLTIGSILSSREKGAHTCSKEDDGPLDTPLS